MRLEPQAHERLDRTTTIAFTYNGKPVTAFAGDTIGSALYAAGRRTFSRSFKYHRPRGLLCCQGHCPNCQMTVDGIPNVRTCATPVREGMSVKPQNYLGSLDFDLMAITDKIGGPFTPPGFYYKTFIRPKAFWPLYEKFLRGAAGLGSLDPEAERTERYDVEHRHVEVLVVGGGRSGLEAAIEAAQGGQEVALVDEGPAPGGELLFSPNGADEASFLAKRARDLGVEVLAPATAIGVYEGGLVPVEHGNLLIRFRAEHVVAAAGISDQPLVFPGNDLVGVMFPTAVRRLVNFWSIRPGGQAVVLTVDDRGLAAADDLRRAGTTVADVVDFREQAPRSLAAKGSHGRVKAMVGGRQVDRLRPRRDGWKPPARLPAARARRRDRELRRARAASSSRPTCPPACRRSAGARATSARSPPPRPCSARARAASSATARTRRPRT